jgi:preprotein translocase subunit SecF
MSARTYKKYMKKNVNNNNYTLLKLFIISFFGMLLVFTFVIKSFSPTVDVSIGDNVQEENYENLDEVKKRVDGRLAMIQEEDLGRNFSELMQKASENEQNNESSQDIEQNTSEVIEEKTIEKPNEKLEPVYKVYIGTYTSAEQAKVAKDIILETGSNYNPIVKCIGSNNYTLQIGLFKSKTSAEALLYTVQQNHLPGRIVQEY